MSQISSILPAGFESLEPFVETWAVSSAAERARRRSAAGEGAREAFYAAAKNLLAPGLEYLDQKPLADLDAAERRLMNLFLSLAHVSLAIEAQGDAEATHASFRQHLRITRAPSDRHA